jgi:hypothetical protein
MESDLFDRNSEPPDQPRNLVQMLGIAILNRLREPDQAFVIAQDGDILWDDRRHRPSEIGLIVWHGMTS